MHLRGGNKTQWRLTKCKRGKDKSIQDDDIEVENDKNKADNLFFMNKIMEYYVYSEGMKHSKGESSI